MLRRLSLVATSALCLGALAAFALDLLAASERDVLMAARRDLKTEAAAVEADWRRTGAELAQLSVNTAGDATLGFDVRALAAAVESYNPDGRLADALAQRIDSLRARLSERLLQFRHINPEVESVALMNTDGQVLAANSSRWVVGQSVLPAPGTEQPAPLPEFMLKGLTGTPQSGIWVEKNAVWWVSVAPIWARPVGKDASAQPTLAGVALLEQPLRSLPEGLGVSAFVMVDGDVLIGAPPKNMRALPPTPEPFLLAARSARAQLFNASLPFKPLFVNAGHVGVWAQRLHVPGTDRAHGAVMLDLTDLYSAMVTRQVWIVLAAFVAWLLVSGLVLLAGRARPQTATVPPQVLHPAPAPLKEHTPPVTPSATRPDAAGDDGYRPLDLQDVPFEDNTSRPSDANDPLADPADAVALVKSFMAGEPLGQTKAARAVLGDLLDTVPATKAPAAKEPPRDPDEDTGPIKLPVKDKPLAADPEENTGPIKLPVKDKPLPVGHPADAQGAPSASPAPEGAESTAADDGLQVVATGKAVDDEHTGPIAVVKVPISYNDKPTPFDEDGLTGRHFRPPPGSEVENAALAPRDHATRSPLGRTPAFGSASAAAAVPAQADDAEVEVEADTEVEVEPESDDSLLQSNAHVAPIAPDVDAGPVAPAPALPGSATDAEQDGPLHRPSAFGGMTDLAHSHARDQGAEADADGPPQVSARDQLMAMLQAKAKNAHASSAQAEIEPAPFESDLGAESYTPQQEPLEARVGTGQAGDESTPGPFEHENTDRIAVHALRRAAAPETGGGREIDLDAGSQAPAGPLVDAGDAVEAAAPPLPVEQHAADDSTSDDDEEAVAPSPPAPLPARKPFQLSGVPAMGADPTDARDDITPNDGASAADLDAGAPAFASPKPVRGPEEDEDTQPFARRPAFPPEGSAPASSPAQAPVQRSSFFGGAKPAQRDAAAADDPYRKVYEEFLKVRESCGETGELPYGKFVQRLETTRAEVLAKHQCSDVEFAAHVKNGRAALKVTPK